MVGNTVFLARQWGKSWLFVVNPWWGWKVDRHGGHYPPPRWSLHFAPIEDESG